MVDETLHQRDHVDIAGDVVGLPTTSNSGRAVLASAMRNGNQSSSVGIFGVLVQGRQRSSPNTGAHTAFEVGGPGPRHQSVPGRVPAQLLGDRVAHRHRLPIRVQIVDTRQRRVVDAGRRRRATVSSPTPGPSGRRASSTTPVRPEPGRADQHGQAAILDLEIDRTMDRPPGTAHPGCRGRSPAGCRRIIGLWHHPPFRFAVLLSVPPYPRS